MTTSSSEENLFKVIRVTNRNVTKCKKFELKDKS